MRPVLTFLCIALGLACLASAALRDRYTENFCEDKLKCADDSSNCADSFCKGNRPLTTDDCFDLDDYDIFEKCCDGDDGDRDCFDREKRSDDYNPRRSRDRDDDDDDDDDDRNVFEKVGDNISDTFTGDDNAASSLLGSSGVWETLLKAGVGTSLLLLLW